MWEHRSPSQRFAMVAMHNYSGQWTSRKGCEPYLTDGGSGKRGHFGSVGSAGAPQASRSSLSLLSGSVCWNGPEPSRARRCWARRSGPLTARTVLARWKKRERLGRRIGETCGAKVAPSLSATIIPDGKSRQRALDTTGRPWTRLRARS
jgi:hypothetical protein